MKIMRLFLVIGIQFASLQLIASDCIKQSKNEIQESSDFIFLGQVIKVYEDSYLVRVIEPFKGNFADTLTGVINDNVFRPDERSVWLYYAMDVGEGNFLSDFCSGSKTFDYPHGAHDDARLIPPPLFLMNNESEMFLLEQILRSKSLSEMYFEIIELRQKKMQSDMTNQRLEYSNLSDKLTRLERYVWILLGLLTFSLLIPFFRKQTN